jgi:hypothetical protein
MKLFVEKLYPNIEVKLLHSEGNLFRYDENIYFVRKCLLPVVDQIRDKFVDEFSMRSPDKKWRDAFHVTLAFADGASARVSAISASLKHYRPDYMHFWQLKVSSLCMFFSCITHLFSDFLDSV